MIGSIATLVPYVPTPSVRAPEGGDRAPDPGIAALQQLLNLVSGGEACPVTGRLDAGTLDALRDLMSSVGLGPSEPSPVPSARGGGRRNARPARGGRAPAPTPSRDRAPAPAPTPSRDRAPAPAPTPSRDRAPAPAPTPSRDRAPAPAPTPSRDRAPAPAPTPTEVAPGSHSVARPEGGVSTASDRGHVGPAAGALQSPPVMVRAHGVEVPVYGASERERAVIQRTLESMPPEHVAAIPRIAVGDTASRSNMRTGGACVPERDGTGRERIELTHDSLSEAALRRSRTQRNLPDDQLRSPTLLHEAGHVACGDPRLRLMTGVGADDLGDVVYRGRNRQAGGDPRGGAYERFANAYSEYHMDPEGFRRRDPVAAATIERSERAARERWEASQAAPGA